MTEKQQQITFEKGITTIPSDPVCSDNALQDADGMIFRDGEHHVIQPPTKVYDTGEQGFAYPPNLLFKHYHPDSTYTLIFQLTLGDNKGIYHTSNNSGNRLLPESAINGTPQALAIGNYLIVKDDKHVFTFLWKNSSYTLIGNRLPEPTVNFRIEEGHTITHSNNLGNFVSRSNTYVVNSGKAEGVFTTQNANITGIADDKQVDYNNLVVGLYAKNKKAIAERKQFCEPFMACVAVELYDGSYILQSAPQLLFPAIRRNSYAYLNMNSEVSMQTACMSLAFNAQFDYTPYADIVKDVAIFISDGANIYDTTIDQHPVPVPATDNRLYWDRIYHNGTANVYASTNVPNTQPDNPLLRWAYFDPLEHFTDKDILDAVIANGIFYKVASLGIRRTPGWINAAEIIKPHVLENLLVQDRLPIDYFSHSTISGQTAKAYNGRLHLADVKRGFAPVPTAYMPYDNTPSTPSDPLTPSTYDIYVKIDTADGERIIHQTVTTSERLGNYFFYPDPRAKEAVITRSSGSQTQTQTSALTLTLKEHPSLNGAYFLDRLPDGTYEDIPTFISGSTSPTPNDTPENLFNQLFVSDVNNPFRFPPEGNITVGTGRVLAMASMATALSQGQFGQYPLIVFTTQGIWAVNVGADGVYVNARPMSREVCTNTESVTETDGAVFFASEKGLMRVVGSQVDCVSRQLTGNSNFPTLLKQAKIAYDYRDALLWIITSGSPYVYAIESGTFSKISFPVDNVIPDYPDALLQHENLILSFSQRTNPASDPYPYSATLTSRPMKLENAMALKTIMQARHVISISNGASMQWTIYGSNNLTTWHQLTSLGGTPWKYYQFNYQFNNIKATDTFAGTVVVTQERRTDKIR